MKRLLVLLLCAVPCHASFDVFTSTKFGVWQGSSVTCGGYFTNSAIFAAEVAVSTTNNLNTVRTNLDVWTQLEPGFENYYYPVLDQMIATSTSALETFLFNIPIHNNLWSLPSGSDTHVPEQILVRLYNLCTNLVNRYSGVVHYWEIWNEPDNGNFWNNEHPASGIPNAREYLQFLQVAYTAIKKADPTASVVLGGIAFPYNSNSNSWLDQFLSQGGGNYFDIMNIHIYGDVGTTGFVGYIPATATFNTAMTTTRSKMSAYGISSKPIWITELDSTGSTYAAGGTTAQDQARYLTESFTQVLSTTNVQRVIWHALQDCGGEDFGMFGSTGGAKLASEAWQAYQAQLLGFTPQGQITNNGFIDYQFNSGATTKFVVWPTSATASGLSPGAFSSFQFTDMFNTSTTTVAAANVGAVVLYSSSPVFITGVP